MKKDINKQNTVIEAIMSVMLVLYAFVLYAFGRAGNDFFYSGITTPEKIVFWITAVIGIAAFFFAVNSELRYGKSQIYRFFCMMVLCAGLLPLIANAYDKSAGSEIIIKMALGMTASGLVLACISRPNTVVALICFALTAAGAFLPQNETLLNFWVVALFVLPVISAVLSWEIDKGLSWLRVIFCCVCGGVCIMAFLNNRMLYCIAAPCCILYTAMAIWFNARGLKRIRDEKKRIRRGAVSEADVEEQQTEQPESVPTADEAPAKGEKTTEKAAAPVHSEGEKTEVVYARQIKKSIAQELAMTERFEGVIAFLLDSNGRWFRYSRTRRDVFPCDDVFVPPLGSLLEKETADSVIKEIRSRESCEIPCRIWDNRLCEYSDAMIKSAPLPDGRKYVLAIDISSAVTNDKKRIAELEKKNKELQWVIDSKERDERRIFRAINESFISLIENRSEESVKHLNNISLLTTILLKKARELFPEKKITDEFIRDVGDASIFYDIGKIKVPSDVLGKEGKYDSDEYEQMKLHTVYGGEIINRMPYTASQEQMLKYAYEIAVKHHERIDGKGYPNGLTEEQIPFYVQIVSLADVYEALISKRVYKDKIPFDEAVEMIRKGTCGAFSPDVLKCLNESEEELRNTQLA